MCVQALSFSVNYPLHEEMEAELSELWAKDMDYFQSKVRVNRSENTVTMTQAEGRYFEAAYSLLDIMDYVKKYVIQRVSIVGIKVDPSSNKTNVSISGWLREDPDSGDARFVTINMAYDIEEDLPLGKFTIDVIPRVDRAVRAFDVTCGKPLCYSENFPAPSVLIRTIRDAISLSLESGG